MQHEMISHATHGCLIIANANIRNEWKSYKIFVYSCIIAGLKLIVGFETSEILRSRHGESAATDTIPNSSNSHFFRHGGSISVTV